MKPVQTTLSTIGLIPLIVFRKLLESDNLLAAPAHKDPAKRPKPTCPFKYRPDDGFGTDIDNPTASMDGAPIGRNMATVPKHLRNHRGGPDVQVVAQRLLARESFKPAGDQLNITAAAWIQAMVHDWIQHFDGPETTLEKGEGLCPLGKFKFFETKERPDGHYNSNRTQWWDASFVYGQNAEQVKDGRSFKGGKMKVDPSNPDVLPSRPDGTDLIGDNSNSWVGVTVLQEIFVKEHNYVAQKVAGENPGLSDDEIFGYSRNIISALVAKIHTVDWTCELLKTEQLRVGMNANWYGLTKAVLGKWAPFSPLRIIQKKKAENNDVPFSLSEEFAAVYRLHPLLPPGLVIEDNESHSSPLSFIELKDCVTAKGRDLMRTPGMPKKVMKSIFDYPCGNLEGANYPDAMRDVSPTDMKGVDLPEGFKIDLAAIDLYRDRERGIPAYNDFRRKINLKPWKSWKKMTADAETAKKLEAIYGPAPEGIEKCDLLVGELYEKKIPGFAISETSFIIFLLMASRRLDADPYLNELFTEEYYTQFGIKHIENVSGLLDLLKRHYPDIAEPFVNKGQSAFKPIYGPEKWTEAVDNALPKDLLNLWAETKKANDAFFNDLSDNKR